MDTYRQIAKTLRKQIFVLAIIVFTVTCAVTGTPSNALANDIEYVSTSDKTAIHKTWEGPWMSPTRGYIYTGEMHLKMDAKYNVTGYINWTMDQSPRLEDQEKLGYTGVEYIKGTYKPSSRMLKMEGYKKDDPNGILGLDRYQLILAENNKALGGITYSNGTWRGMFSLGLK